jgi:hypothetical protein
VRFLPIMVVTMFMTILSRRCTRFSNLSAGHGKSLVPVMRHSWRMSRCSLFNWSMILGEALRELLPHAMILYYMYRIYYDCNCI